MIHFGSSPAMQQLRGDVGGGGGQMPPGTKPPATWAAGFTSTPREGEFPLLFCKRLMIDMPCVDRISLICFGSTDVFSNYLNPFLLQAATVHAVPEPAGLKSSTACAGDDAVHGPWGLSALCR